MTPRDSTRDAAGSTTLSELDFSRIRLILFDLDGTLVDSLGDLSWCGNEMLRQLGQPQRDPQQARAWVGNGLERLVKRFLTGDMDAEPEPDLLRRGREIFNLLYADNVSVHSRVYPGVRACLEQLATRDLHLGCVTNKAEAFTLRLLELMQLDEFFELVVSGDTTPRIKPDPMQLHFASDHFGLEHDQCLMVGDSRNDIEAARAAGFMVIGVPYGYNHGHRIQDCNPDLVVENLVELTDLFT